ncbi:MAG: phage GP46 family protein [Chitinispirillaceae bacterium]|nr:phage GP46 family protein [Chitinispirillaceae bacterium]
MPRDFAITVDTSTGEADLAYDATAADFAPVDDCRNNLILSVVVARESFFANTSFGSGHARLKKKTSDIAAEIERHIVDATKWIVQAGRCIDITVSAEEDRAEPNRINIQVVARKSNGDTVPFTTFVRVI